MAGAPVIINSPNSAQFRPGLEIKDMMGTWYVTHSTLPLWKNKKDVTISYTPVDAPSTSSPLQFDDVVEYRAQSSPASAKRSRVVGVDTLDTASRDAAPTRFKWRGKGLLMIASSRWQLLGYGPSWAVTYFEKTLFTPAGLDIYARTAQGLSEDLVQDIKKGLTAVGGDVGILAESLFEVHRSQEAA
ncbi:hypothetical protein BV25DRAFT_1520346 [Artomyces pyxidatus]|uniref:Uncharacterized protein n=1 Tax=Artomyces pyxidatus TaxID=48021 RepID=A0ACB8TCC0_9AGAM|nr:hypothetical protein BV25DRAFT_1520346 [Artomyces pyxidatus]